VTVPSPRDEHITTGEPLLTYVANTVGRLEEMTAAGFREVRENMADLRRETVARTEFDQQHGELRDRVARIEVAREAERQAAVDAAREAARDARSQRWQRIALASSSALALAGTATGVFLHFH
jgi:septal ring factor EnvC (AmiA/AmiB activator)